MHFRSLLLSWLASVVICTMNSSAEEVTAYVVLLKDGKIVVENIKPDELPDDTTGLLIWIEDDQEHWTALTPGWREKLQQPPKDETKVAALPSWSRGSRGGAGSARAFASLNATLQLPPASTSEALRAIPFLTPLRDARILSQTPIVRRAPQEKEPKYPAVKAQLTGLDDKIEQSLTLAAGQTSQQLPELKPGRYSFQLEGGEAVAFMVVPKSEVDMVQARAQQFAALAGSAKDPAAVLYSIESLLTLKNKAGVPQYLGDILDQIDTAPQAKASPYLQRQRQQLWHFAEQSAGIKNPQPQQVMPGATGIALIDQGRKALLAGNWKQAEELFVQAKKEALPQDRARAGALATLYQAVLASEAGANRTTEAEGLFAQAVEELRTAPKPDQLRAHNNYANFLHRQAQDRINNHAFQMAAGVHVPLFTALQYWLRAEEEYRLAYTLSGAEDRATVRINQARLNALLADWVRTLAVEGKTTTLLETNLIHQADQYATEASKATSDDPLIQGIALELRAQLALRSKNTQDCRTLAQSALQVYVAEGFLAGIEQVERLLGQNALAGGDMTEATKSLEMSHLIGELLRDRLAPELTGQTQAGFFARRAFVLDALVELKIQAQQYAEALQYAELAKARALQDILATRSNGPGKARPLAEILKNWPAQTAAVEYFLGRDKAWVFVIRIDGTVMAYPLPVAPRELLTEIQGFLRNIEGYAPRMLNRYLAGKGFDNTWQDTLFEFRKALIPDAALAELRRAETVVIVPQHILHYFPFAALVTKPQEKPEAKKVAKPQMLLDEKFILSIAPSLTAWDMLQRVKPAVMKEARAVGLVQAPGEIPLPGVETDLNNLKEAFGTRVKTILADKEATTGNTQRLLKSPGLLLLATHGFNEADHPLDSFLLLLPNEETTRGTTELNDGRLRAKTIFQTNIEPDLVIMSACYTGLADRSPLPGDDLFGLQRAFLHGGARTVLAGYWDVYDGTSPELLGATLKSMGQGQPIGIALKQAQLDFLNKYRASTKAEPYLHPYFWAVYSLLGDERTRFAK